MSISDLLGGTLLQVIKDVIAQFKLPPEKKAELEALLEKNRYELAVKQAELEAKLSEQVAREIEAASANVRAEGGSPDKFTSRARPTFLYIANAMLIANYIVFPLIGRGPLQFPEPLFWLFGSVMLGYTGARTWEKVALGKNGQTK